MLWMSLVVAGVSAAEPCEPPRIRDTGPLVAAIAQDRVMAQTFTKAATACAERGEACDQARLECATLLTSTNQKQTGFDEGQWLRDMLLPYNGGSYPMTRTFGAAAIAGDASCNVDVATLTAAAGRRTAQATRRDALLQEHQGYARWTQTQLQKCKERVAADDAKNAAARAESERLLAASAAVTAAEALKLKQQQEAAAAQAAAEKKAKEAAEAEAARQRELKETAEKEAKKREDAEKQAREDRERDRKAAEERAQRQEDERKKERAELEAARKKEKEEQEEKLAKEKKEAEQRVQAAKDEAERKQREAEEKRLVTERDTRVAQQRQTKERLVKEAEDNLKRAKDEEALKKQAAVDAVSSSPAIAQAAVAEAAQAERARIEAEKRLVDAHQKADAIVIDDSYERSSGSLGVLGGVSAIDSSLALGVLGAVHFGFWGTAPSDGMASGFEVRLWGRYSGTVTGTPAAVVDSLLTARYFFGAVGLGVAGELRMFDPGFASLRGGVGPALAVAFVDNKETRVLFGVNYLPLGNTIDTVRFIGDFEVSWRFLTFHVNGGTLNKSVNGVSTFAWQVGGFVGVRAAW